jgi:hypothetical protein
LIVVYTQVALLEEFEDICLVFFGVITGEVKEFVVCQD